MDLPGTGGRTKRCSQGYCGQRRREDSDVLVVVENRSLSAGEAPRRQNLDLPKKK